MSGASPPSGRRPGRDVLEGDGGGEPFKVATTGVSGTFFDVLGADAAARPHDSSRR